MIFTRTGREIKEQLRACALLGASILAIGGNAQTVSGTVTDVGSVPLENMRVTLYNSDTSFFNENRTDARGAFVFSTVPAGNYLLNASRADRAYTRVAVTTNGVDPLTQDLMVEVDTVMGRTVGFTDGSTSDNMIIVWTWDFGDGGMATEPSPQHTYVHPGIYTLCLTTLDDHGCTTTHCQHVTVHHPVVGTCHAGFAYTTVADDLAFAFFDASDSEFPITSWVWDFGDGITSIEEDTQHTYAHAGIYTVCKTLYDDHGGAATVCQELIVHHPEGMTCHANFTFAPVNDLGLDFTDTSGGDIANASWSWDFGDGNTSTGATPVPYLSPRGLFYRVLDHRG